MSGIVVLILRIMLVLSLYGFLAWAMLMLWRDLRTHGRMISSPEIPALSLTPLSAPQGEQAQPKMFSQPEVIIGRSSKSDLSIRDDTVSSRHARLSYHHSQWWVEDMRSTNGSFLNDERVSVPTVIVSGDELRCGQIGLLIGIEEKGHS